MLFNSLVFLAFFAAFVGPYFATRGRARILVVLAASYIFYGWWDWRFCGLLILSTVVDFEVGRRMAVTEVARARKRLLVVSLAVNLGVLGIFKYFDFFIESFAALMARFGAHPDVGTLGLVLPVGISFYTFQTLSYTIDIYRRDIEPEPDLWRFSAYVAFFPQLVAGPIVRARDFLPQLREAARFDADRIESGARLAIWGYFKKVVVADSLAAIVDHRFRAPEAHDALSLSIGVVAYAFQIYADFSGYSDIAIGVARMLGFDFPENFRRPYFATSFREFWRRWHISLSGWLRDYLYIPLGGNRSSKSRMYRNLMLTMLLGGLWHGANWTFVIWGALHGGYLIVERVLARPWGWTVRALRIPGRVRALLQMAAVFALTCVAWIFFRAQSLDAGMEIVRRLVIDPAFSPSAIMSKFVVAKGLALIVVLVVADTMLEHAWWRRVPPSLRALAFAACLWGIALLGSFEGGQFIYFQF